MYLLAGVILLLLLVLFVLFVSSTAHRGAMGVTSGPPSAPPAPPGASERFGAGAQDIDCLTQPDIKGGCTLSWQTFPSYRSLPAGYGN
jgi:hypothetical protein